MPIEFVGPHVREFDISEFRNIKHVPAKVPEIAFRVVHKNDSPAEDALEHTQSRCRVLVWPFAGSAPRDVTIKMAKVLVQADTATGAKRTVELELDGEHFDGSLLPGDTIAIVPRNPSALVQHLLARLNLLEYADKLCCIEPKPSGNKRLGKRPAHIPETATPRALLTDCLELNAVPKKQLLSALAACTAEPAERDFLSYLASKEAAGMGGAYERLVLSLNGFRLLDLLTICSSCLPNLALLVHHLPRLLPRPYSIANDCSGGRLRIVYSVLARPNPGVTTSWLETKSTRLERADSATATLLAYSRTPTTFRFQRNAYLADQLLIGLGTALAPFIGYLEHKARMAATGAQQLGRTWLYAGAKSPQAMIKRGFFERLQAVGVLDVFQPAYSRQGDCKHVQDLFKADAKALVEFIVRPQTTLYICAGSAKATASVRAALKVLLVMELAESEEAVECLLSEYKTAGKYLEDLWL